MQLEPNVIHIYLIDLAITADDEFKQIAYLSQDECARAERFHAPTHRKHFIAARFALRKILSHYLNTAIDRIYFDYSEHGKPYLKNPSPSVQFNIAHSDNMALCALTLNHPVGIDIEKMVERSFLNIAKRFFSPEENQALIQLPTHKQMTGFYQLWTRKEALAKAVGRGLQVSFTDFSVKPEPVTEQVFLEDRQWTVLSLDTTPDYQAALASDQPIKDILVWKFEG